MKTLVILLASAIYTKTAINITLNPDFFARMRNITDFDYCLPQHDEEANLKADGIF
jgi:hypothetical protein